MLFVMSIIHIPQDPSEYRAHVQHFYKSLPVRYEGMNLSSSPVTADIQTHLVLALRRAWQKAPLVSMLPWDMTLAC